MNGTAPDFAVYPNLRKLWDKANDLGLRVSFESYGSAEEYNWSSGVLGVAQLGPHKEYLTIRTYDNWYDHKPKERRTRGILHMDNDSKIIGLRDADKIIDRWVGIIDE